MAAWQVALRALVLSAAVAPAPWAQEAPAATADTVPEKASEPATGDAPANLVRMGTGNVAAVYYPVGVALCRLANQHREESGLRCAATQTAGSVANVAGLRDGSLGLAIVQSDALAAAVSGTGAFASAGPDDGLRTVMGLYPEALTLVVRPQSGVERVEDLAGKRIVVGAEGTGTRPLADALIGALGWTAESFGATPEIAPEELGRALCDDQIDGFFYVVGHPARVIQETTTSCEARLVPIEGAAIDALVDAAPTYVKATIPGGLYRGNTGPVPTFGVTAMLVTEASVPDATVQTVLGSVVDDLDTLRGLEPVLADFDPAAQARTDFAAPLHPAAETIYREKGWR